MQVYQELKQRINRQLFTALIKRLEQCIGIRQNNFPRFGRIFIFIQYVPTAVIPKFQNDPSLTLEGNILKACVVLYVMHNVSIQDINIYIGMYIYITMSSF